MKKTLTLVLALVLIASLAVGGTLAYFTSKTETAVNTFKVSGENVEITVTEPGWDPDTAELIPGAEITKDPTITVTGEMPCYLVVEVLESDPNDYISWTATGDWTLIADPATYGFGTGTYYVYTGAANQNDVIKFLEGDKVTVNANADEANAAVTLQFVVYAVQADLGTAAEAFTLANGAGDFA